MHDLVVVGSGVAGLTAALTAASRGRVALVTKAALEAGCTRHAQGGIAVALGDDDSAQLHFEDTMAAGRGLCDPAAVRVLVEEAPARLRDLSAWGVVVDTEGAHVALGREAAHSQNRIVHAGGDTTGLAVETALAARVRAAGVSILEHALVQRLLIDERGRCCGVALLDAAGVSRTLCAPAVLLASGGASRLWRNSTNPDTATGDGVALAFAAGADITSMEFEQFHPTALAVPGAPRFLISEAMRGEGAVVRDGDGTRFLLDYDERGELAGRDVVSRSIWDRLQRSGEDHVYLDCTPIGAARVRERFPQIHATCLSHGIDCTQEWIPIAPAAHYTIGGVRTDLRGTTGVPGLYACGEVASTGVHGANRLASNSLLESMVFGPRAAHAALSDTAELRVSAPFEAGPALRTGDERCAPLWSELQDAMWRHAGIVRDAEGLQAAVATCEEIKATASAWEPSRDAVQLTHAASTAGLVCRSALARQESRGAHFRSDFPQTASDWHGVIVMQHERREGRVDHA